MANLAELIQQKITASGNPHISGADVIEQLIDQMQLGLRLDTPYIVPDYFNPGVNLEFTQEELSNELMDFVGLCIPIDPANTASCPLNMGAGHYSRGKFKKLKIKGAAGPVYDANEDLIRERMLRLYELRTEPDVHGRDDPMAGTFTDICDTLHDIEDSIEEFMGIQPATPDPTTGEVYWDVDPVAASVEWPDDTDKIADHWTQADDDYLTQRVIPKFFDPITNLLQIYGDNVVKAIEDKKARYRVYQTALNKLAEAFNLLTDKLNTIFPGLRTP